MLAFLAAAGLSILQIKSIAFMCAAEMPGPTQIVLTCGMAVDGKMVNVVASPVLEVTADVDPRDLAGAYCTGIHDLLGVQPRTQHQI